MREGWCSFRVPSRFFADIFQGFKHPALQLGEGNSAHAPLPGQRVVGIYFGQPAVALGFGVAVALGIADRGVIAQKWREVRGPLGRQQPPDSIVALVVRAAGWACGAAVQLR